MMGPRRFYSHPKTNAGPCSWKCCRCFGDIRKQKVFAHRIERRNAKQALRKEAE